MNILLTGGLGYIGSHAAIAIAARGHNAVLLDNLSKSQYHIALSIASIVGKPCAIEVGDIRDTEFLVKVMAKYSIDSVIHFAGFKSVSESISNPSDYYLNNVYGSMCLVQAMARAKVHTLVFSSSATTYGEPQYLPIDELHPLQAINPYGRTKIHIEQMLADEVRSSAKWHIASLRYFNPGGAHGSGLIGDDPEGLPNNLLPYIGRIAIGQYKSLRVFGGDYPTIDGSGLRDYIHVEDLANGHLAALDFLDSQPGFHAFNLGTGQAISVLQVLKTYEKACGHPIAYEIVERREGDVAECYAEPTLSHQLLRWRTQRGIEEICASDWLFRKSKAK